MTPTATTEQSIRDYPPPARAESPVQLIQGWYYFIVGLWVALGIVYLQSPTQPTMHLSHLWVVRCVGFFAAIVGIGLIWASGRKKENSLLTGGAITLTILFGLAEVIAMINGTLPVTFLLDTAMELGFFVWWMFALYFGERLIGRTTPSLDH